MKHITGNLKSAVGFWRLLSILVLSLSIGTGVCLAHKINVFAIVEKDSLVVEGYFSGKVKAENSPVEVYDSTGAKVATGRTDTQGVCKINLAEIKPIKGDLKVVIATGDGHKAEYTVKAAEIPSKLK